MIRMPEGMRDRLAEAAKANGRSMNSEVVARLEASFAKPKMPFLGDIVFGNETAAQMAEEVARLVLLQLKTKDDPPPKPQFTHGSQRRKE